MSKKVDHQPAAIGHRSSPEYPPSRISHASFLVASFLGLLLAGGCCLPKVPSPRSLDSVIREHNARVATVPMLYCPRMRVSGEIRPPGRLFGSGYDLEANLLYIPPRKLRLSGNMAGVEVLGLGANPERYWLYVKAGIDAMWWGYWANADKPGVLPLPLRADELVEAVSLMPVAPRSANEELSLETRCTEEVVTFWRYDPTERKFLGLMPLPKPDPRGTPVRTRQYFFDRLTRDLTDIRIYDDKGTFVVREAKLLNYQVADCTPLPVSTMPADPDLIWMGIQPTSAPASQPAEDLPPVRMPTLVKIMIYNDGNSGSAWFNVELGRPRFRNPQVSPKAFDFPRPIPTREVIWVDGMCR